MPALTLIPGLLCNRRLWRSQAKGLKTHADITVADITGQSTITDMAVEVLRTAPEHFSLAGFSLGSQVALEIMRLSRERVDRLALLSATHGGLPPAVRSAIRRAVAVLEQGGFEQYLEDVYPTYVARHRAEDAELKDVFVRMAHAVGVQAGLRQMKALLAITNPFNHLEQIRCPTLIVGGRDDGRITPAAHQTLAQEIAGSELVIISDAGHFTPIEQPPSVTAVLRRWMTM
jgi:pimeloyl-ACP methyl ester carboxylesterase